MTTDDNGHSEYYRAYQQNIREKARLLEKLYRVFTKHAAEYAPLFTGDDIDIIKKVKQAVTWKWEGKK